jgi:hypothetical protein
VSCRNGRARGFSENDRAVSDSHVYIFQDVEHGYSLAGRGAYAPRRRRKNTKREERDSTGLLLSDIGKSFDWTDTRQAMCAVVS